MQKGGETPSKRGARKKDGKKKTGLPLGRGKEEPQSEGQLSSIDKEGKRGYKTRGSAFGSSNETGNRKSFTRPHWGKKRYHPRNIMRDQQENRGNKKTHM